MVDAIIFGKNRTNIASVEKPSGAKPEQRFAVYKMLNEFEATRIEVQFGQLSDNSIEVISGLQPGDKIIVSAPNVQDEINAIC